MSVRIQLGRAIRRLRSERGLSQEALADLVGMHRNQAGVVERGEANLTLETIERIPKGLGVSVFELFAQAENERSR